MTGPLMIPPRRRRMPIVVVSGALLILVGGLGLAMALGGGPGGGPRPSDITATTSTASAGTTATAGSAPSSGSWWRPVVGTSWQWQLTGKVDLSARAGVYDLDLFGTAASTVAAVHAQGAKAICYLETGGWESYRPDASRYPTSVLGRTMSDYPDERYVDLRQLTVLRPIIDARLDLCAQKGFDGVEPDIDDSVVDVGAKGIGFAVTYADQLAFNRMVSQDAHARGLAIGLKNGISGEEPERFAADMLPLVDFAVNEECAVDGDVCAVLRVFTDSGRPVFHAEYLDDYPKSSTTRYQQVLDAFCPGTSALAFSSILKDASASLSAWRATCP
jgi:endo-alpha-1,4-polygalactosaminidase (GH114 family)